MKKVIALLIVFFVITGIPSVQYLFSQGISIPRVAAKDRICFALYTVHKNILKLTAQLYPLENVDDIRINLEVKQKGKWIKVAETEVVYPGYTAPFRVTSWDSSRDIPYRVNHQNKAFFYGVIKKDPVSKTTITLAAFTGNSIYTPHGGDIPRSDIVDNLKRIKPDLLFFSGDQVYDHARHLAYWLKFGRDFGEVIGSTPTICIPDDHDVGQYNLWGDQGKKSSSRAGPDGGYYMPIEYVKEVERAQTSHLPDPYDPTPLKRGLGVYYTSLTWGRISFAILEDRKFKSGPKGLVRQRGPRPDHVAVEGYNPAELDVKGAVLLGERQEKFLHEWSKDWFDCDLKAVLSQTIFCGGAHIHGKVGGRVLADLDSNGWPQSGRARALEEMRRCFALHIAGDQHLATIFQHGIHDWNDAGFSFCVPSIANLYLRWWKPLSPGKKRKAGLPWYTGQHLDGFGNRITCWAAANPSEKPNGGNKLTTRAAGFGIIKFNKETRKITMECWPRNLDITAKDARQYPGWPKTIEQQDNYGRRALAYLPALEVQGVKDPIIQIVHQSSGKIVYTLRIKGSYFRPKVFKKGIYQIRIFDLNYHKILPDIPSLSPDKKKKMTVRITKSQFIPHPDGSSRGGAVGSSG